MRAKARKAKAKAREKEKDKARKAKARVRVNPAKARAKANTAEQMPPPNGPTSKSGRQPNGLRTQLQLPNLRTKGLLEKRNFPSKKGNGVNHTPKQENAKDATYFIIRRAQGLPPEKNVHCTKKANAASLTART